jgi:hypothetical protein
MRMHSSPFVEFHGDRAPHRPRAVEHFLTQVTATNEQPSHQRTGGNRVRRRHPGCDAMPPSRKTAEIRGLAWDGGHGGPRKLARLAVRRRLRKQCECRGVRSARKIGVTDLDSRHRLRHARYTSKTWGIMRRARFSSLACRSTRTDFVVARQISGTRSRMRGLADPFPDELQPGVLAD